VAKLNVRNVFKITARTNDVFRKTQIGSRHCNLRSNCANHFHRGVNTFVPVVIMNTNGRRASIASHACSGYFKQNVRLTFWRQINRRRAVQHHILRFSFNRKPTKPSYVPCACERKLHGKQRRQIFNTHRTHVWCCPCTDKIVRKSELLELFLNNTFRPTS